MAGCSPATEYVYIERDIPDETLTPCPISARMVQTVTELAVLATDHRRSAECANGKIETIAEIILAEQV
ncbi:hypothetical protein [Falsihalocynthiibacter arcticus]|uniref:Rz1-like lysis system protein LysC n=1 Tax=Falsihalocynthiibacter arcticus TaxID=1579316 RepID=UPI003AB9AF12